MPTYDFKDIFRRYYSPKAGKPEILSVPPARYLMLDGAGDPDSQAFEQSVGALYGAAYTIKFTRKKAGQPDFKVAPLEGIWWMKGGRPFEQGKRQDWVWTLMIAMPDFVTQADLDAAIADLKVKRPNPALAGLRLDTLAEGEVAQAMHLGPYATEPETITKIQAFIAEQGYEPAGRHHEIYLGDPRRAAPEKLKTILRWPVKKAT